jgi:hypothetical protein
MTTAHKAVKGALSAVVVAAETVEQVVDGHCRSNGTSFSLIN